MTSSRVTSNRTFDPWIGPDYYRSGLNGLRLLILGESHYGTPEKERRDFTKDVVRRLGLRMEGKHRFFTITAKVVLGRGKDGVSKSEMVNFWNSVAFYNYIQSIVPKARKSPSRVMWLAGKAPFLDTISELRPDAVLVLGEKMGKDYLSQYAERIPPYCWITHPSSSRFSYGECMPKVQEFLASP